MRTNEKEIKNPGHDFLQDAAGNNSSKRLCLFGFSGLFLIFAITLFVTSFFMKIADTDTALTVLEFIGILSGGFGVATVPENIMHWRNKNNDI